MKFKTCAEAEAAGMVVKVGSQARIAGEWADVSYPAQWDAADIGGHCCEVMSIKLALSRFDPTYRYR